MHAGQLALVAVMVLLPLALIIRATWVPWVMQVILLLGAVEWLRTLYVLTQLRIDFGLPWARMAIILGLVALFTALSSLVFRGKELRKRYGGDKGIF